MADYDLEALSLSELKKMQKDVAKAISTYQDRQKAEARAKVEALARDLGYSLAELVGTETKSSRAPVVNRPGFTGGQNSRRIAHHGTDIKEEDLEAVFTRVPRTCGAVGDGTPR